jgi:sigma-70-like protein
LRDVSHLSILEAAELLGASTRLRNALKAIVHIVSLPTVADYTQMGPAGEEMLLAIPGIGRTCVRELWTLLQAAVEAGGPRNPLHRDRCIRNLPAGSEERSPSGLPDESHDPTGNADAKAVEHELLSPEDVLAQLGEKDREVLERRFGLLGKPEETLAEIGETLAVTRERVRQIEYRALGILRRRFREDLEAFLQDQADSIWDRLASDADGLAVSSLRLDGKFLLPTENLALAVSQGTVKGLLDSVGTSVDGGWIRRGLDHDGLMEARRLVGDAVNGGMLPISIDSPGCCDSSALVAATELQPKAGKYLNYVVRLPLTKRARRTVRAHRILRQEAARACIPLKSLHASYRAKYGDDPCSTRDLTIVMGEARHLFLNLYEDGWSPFGVPLATNQSDGVGVAPLVQGDDTEQDDVQPGDGDGSVTVAGVLRKILREAGPITFDDLRDQFMLRANGAYSRSSVGPVLLMHTDFVRFAPGIYGLEEQLSQPERVGAGRRLLLDERQLTLYCQARWAREPAGLYPLWTPTMERAWADWALSKELKDPLDALLSIADIESWPIGGAEQAKWRMRRDLRGGFHLTIRNPFSLSETVPTYIDILRAAVAARYKGGLSWIAANRVRGLRVDDRHAHSVLAFLVLTGILAPADHWQSWHRFEPAQAGLVDELAQHYIATDGVVWPKAVIGRSSVYSHRELGWIDKEEARALVELMLAGQSLGAATFVINEREDLDSLMREVAVRKAIRDEGLL